MHKMTLSTRVSSLENTMSPTDRKRNVPTKNTQNASKTEEKIAKKTAGARSTPGTSQKQPVISKAKNLTKNEEKSEKQKPKMRDIQGFYELTKKDTDEETDSDVDSAKTRPNKETPVLQDTEVTRLKGDLITLCDIPDGTKRRSLELERAMMAISYIKMIQSKSTKIPVSTCKAIDQALQVVINSLTEIELRATHAEAKAEALEIVTETRVTQPTEKETSTLPAQKATKKTSVAHTYAQAVTAATATVIIQATEERTAEEVEQQITNTVENKEGVRSVKRIRNGIKIICENATEATRIKEALAENEESSSGLNVKTANLRKKRIIIFHVPESTEPATIKHKICRELGIDKEQNEDKIQLLKSLRAPAGRMHIPVTLPEPLADHLLKERTICLGLRECPIKNYVTIQRCHKCQGFDHVAHECKQSQYCSICAGTHKYEDCPKKRKRCIICTTFNEWNKEHLPAQIPIDHTAHDGQCRVYRKLLKIRQIELEQGKTKLTTGNDVLNDKITINTIRGVTRVHRRSQEELNNRQQRTHELNYVQYRRR